MKFSLSRFLAFTLAATLFIPQTSAQVALNPDPIGVVNIPDPNLRQAIRETLQLPTDMSITQQEMLNLTQLRAPYSEIVDLTGLEYATHLDTLYMWGNEISDLTSLANLVDMRRINVAGNEISDITPLANLTKLVFLNIGWNNVRDIKVLEALINLDRLILLSNPITDYRPLDGLTLTRLERDERCVSPPVPVHQRIQDRTYPSVFSAWAGVGWSSVINLPELSGAEQLALHDLFFTSTDFREMYDGWSIVGQSHIKKY